MVNIGLGEEMGIGQIFNSTDENNSEIAIIYKEAFEKIFSTKNDISCTEFEINTIDDYCSEGGIKK